MNLKNELITPTIKTIKDLIGNQLSQSPTQTGTTPSVIRLRSNTPQPSFPYASVTYLNARQVGIQERHSYLDDNEDEITEFDFIVKVVVRVHDSEGGDSLGILENLRHLLLTSKGKRIIRENFNNASLLSVSSTTLFPSFMVTDYEESSRLILDFWVRSVVVDETSDVIENVDINGEVYDDYDQDYPPININIKAP